MGELQQVLGKLIAFPQGVHPDGRDNLKTRLEEEAGHVLAALSYFLEINDVDIKCVEFHQSVKWALYKEWGLTGVPLEPLS